MKTALQYFNELETQLGHNDLAVLYTPQFLFTSGFACGLQQATNPEREPLLMEPRRQGIDRLLPLIRAWQKTTFPTCTVKSTMLHLWSEIQELQNKTDDPAEIADCIMLLICLASLQGIDITDALYDKFRINLTRSWGPPNERGFSEHIRNPAPDGSNAG